MRESNKSYVAGKVAHMYLEQLLSWSFCWEKAATYLKEANLLDG